MDDPEEIISLITEYPEFKPLYQHIYDMCENVERMMGMFSKELQIMDRNTVRYMVDQMQKELDKKSRKLQKQTIKLKVQNAKLQKQNTKLWEQDIKLQEQNTKLQEQIIKLQEQDRIIKNLQNQLKKESQEKQKL